MKRGRRSALSALLMTTLLASLLGAAWRVAPALSFTSSSTPTTLPVLSGNGLNGPKGMAVVGSQVWVANYGNSSISRFNQDGTFGTSATSPITGNGLGGPYGLTVVGSQVWVVNSSTNSISRFNQDGTTAGSPIAAAPSNGLSTPKGITVVGTQVWVSNNNNTLSRLNPDGTSAGSPLQNNGLNRPRSGTVVNSQVWIPNNTNSAISLFTADGITASSPITGNGLNGPEWAALINGTQVWVPNWSGSVSLFNPDGTAAGKLTDATLSNPHALAQVGTQVWVANYGNSTISRYQLASPTTTSTATATPVAPTSTPTITPVAPLSTPTATPVPPTATGTANDPVVMAAGDIACSPSDASYNNGNGSGTACMQRATSNLLATTVPVLPLGDDQYNLGALTTFQQVYDPSWGRAKAITYPASGNHEYQTSGAAGYYSYFGSAASPQDANCTANCKGYYSYDLGTWHLIVLNSECDQVGGCAAGSLQEQWLAADLAAHPNKCTLAYWHRPRFSSGWSLGDSAMHDLWVDLYNAHADLVLNGHDHTYERFAPQDPSGTADPTNGITEIIAGTGGMSHGSLNSVVANSVVRDNTTFGVLKLTLHPTRFDWQFLRETASGNGTFTDSGSQNCH